MKEKVTKLAMATFVVVGGMVLSGCGQVDDLKDNVQSKIDNGKEMVETGKKVAEDGKGLVGGLKEAMKKGVAMKCVAEDEKNKWVVFTNGKNYRWEGTDERGEKSITVSKDGKTYTWNERTREGQVIDPECFKDMNRNMEKIEGFMNQAEEMDNGFEFTPEELEKEEAEGGMNCTPVAKIDLTVPKDVKFADACKMMKGQMEQLEKMNLNQNQNGGEMPNIPGFGGGMR